MFLRIVLIIVAIALDIAFGRWAMHVAQRRHRNPVVFFILGWFFWFFGVIAAALTRPKRSSPLWRRPVDCPTCGARQHVTRRSAGYQCAKCSTWSSLDPLDERGEPQPIGASAEAKRLAEDTEVLLEVTDLHVSFGSVNAVRGVSYQLRRGETLGIVGESGSGKSVSSLAAMGLLPDTARVSGAVRFRGQELLEGQDSELSRLRGKRIAMIFQDPMTSLDPVYKVGQQIAETLKVHNSKMPRSQMRARAIELLDIVGIPNAADRVDDFPHQFSGGMRQRVVIAIAMANNPDVIIADEPTTALDVTVQATVLEAIKAAQRETGAALVLITHDLGVIAGMADRVLVMYAGRAVEIGTVDDVFYRPRMPYTVGLLNSLPRMDTDEKLRLTPIVGSPPSLQSLPPGCPFSPRCPLYIPECSVAEPPLIEVEGAALHLAACIRSDELKGQDRYEAGQVFEATSADAALPVEFAAGEAAREDEDAAFRPPSPAASSLGDPDELQDPSAAPAVERPTRDEG